VGPIHKEAETLDLACQPRDGQTEQLGRAGGNLFPIKNPSSQPGDLVEFVPLENWWE